MRTQRSPLAPARLLALLAALALVLVACGDDGGDGGGGDDGALSGAELTVGSKEFTEQLVLGQITLQVLEAAGASVTDQLGIQGTENTRAALTSGEIDIYWDYTGTGWTTILGHEVSEAPEDLYQAVSEEDLEQNDIRWLPASEVDNTYALAAKTTLTEDQGISTISDYAELASSSPQDASLCAAEEFLSRDDGWPGVEQAYGFDLPNDEISTLDLGVVYTQIGDTCEFGEVFATDGRIVANELTVLEDDESFFVEYAAAPTTREEIYSEYPEIEEVLTPVIEALNNDVMLELNARVDVEGELPEDVAADWLESNDLLPS